MKSEMLRMGYNDTKMQPVSVRGITFITILSYQIFTTGQNGGQIINQNFNVQFRQ